MATLEALAVLVVFKVVHTETSEEQRTGITIVPTWMNRRNGAALNRFMSSGYPSQAVIMEIAAFKEKASIKAQVGWSRSGNSEADALANRNFGGFDPELRCIIESTNMDWVLPDRTSD